MINVERLARALHGKGADMDASPDEWGTCINWAPGWGDECGPDKHMEEARLIAARYEPDEVVEVLSRPGNRADGRRGDRPEGSADE